MCRIRNGGSSKQVRCHILNEEEVSRQKRGNREQRQKAKQESSKQRQTAAKGTRETKKGQSKSKRAAAEQSSKGNTKATSNKGQAEAQQASPSRHQVPARPWAGEDRGDHRGRKREAKQGHLLSLSDQASVVEAKPPWYWGSTR